MIMISMLLKAKWLTLKLVIPQTQNENSISSTNSITIVSQLTFINLISLLICFYKTLFVKCSIINEGNEILKYIVNNDF